MEVNVQISHVKSCRIGERVDLRLGWGVITIVVTITSALVLERSEHEVRYRLFKKAHLVVIVCTRTIQAIDCAADERRHGEVMKGW